MVMATSRCTSNFNCRPRGSIRSMRSCRDKLQSMIPPDRWTELRFEQLVAEPEPTLSKLCDFIGVAYDPAMLSYPEDTTYDLPSSKMIGQWKRKLRRNQIQLVEERIGFMLSRRGYELSGYPSLRPSPVKERLLRFQDRWYRAHFKRRRYGTFLHLADVITRRLGIMPTQAQIRQRLNQIDVLYLK